MFDQSQAEKRYKNFLTWACKLVVEQKNEFDLIVGPANSGTFLAESVKMIYEQTGLTPPKILVLPIQRHETPGTDSGKKFDNSVVSASIKNELADLKKLKNVLFVDDEISKAHTAVQTIRTILMAVNKNIVADRVLYTIISENHGFEWRYDLPPVVIRYFSFGNKIKWAKTDDQGRVIRDDLGMDRTGLHINGSVFYIMPDEIFNKYKTFTFNLDEKEPRAIGKKELAALFSNGHLKTSKNNIPTLTTETLENIKAIVPDFNSDKQKFMEYVSGLVKDVVENYDEYKKLSIFED